MAHVGVENYKLKDFNQLLGTGGDVVVLSGQYLTCDCMFALKCYIPCSIEELQGYISVRVLLTMFSSLALIQTKYGPPCTGKFSSLTLSFFLNRSILAAWRMRTQEGFHFCLLILYKSYSYCAGGEEDFSAVLAQLLDRFWVPRICTFEDSQVVPLSPRRSASSFRELALIRYQFSQDVKSWKVKLQRLSPLLLLKQLKLSTPPLSFRISHIQLAFSWWCSEAWEQAIGVVCCLPYFMLQLI